MQHYSRSMSRVSMFLYSTAILLTVSTFFEKTLMNKYGLKRVHERVHKQRKFQISDRTLNFKVGV